MEQQITCIVVDDETPALKLMGQYIQQTKSLILLEKFKSPDKALEFLSAQSVDLLFCDIEMGSMNGFGLISKLAIKPMIIFTTAYSEYATKAFEIEAIDYLQKPFSFERFSKAVNKAINLIELKQGSIKNDQDNEAEKNFISVKSGYKTLRIYHNEIILIEGYQEYVKIITEKERVVVLERMKNMEAKLPTDQFIRVHRSYIVSKNRVKSFSDNKLIVADFEVPVSREIKSEILKILF